MAFPFFSSYSYSLNNLNNLQESDYYLYSTLMTFQVLSPAHTFLLCSRHIFLTIHWTLPFPGSEGTFSLPLLHLHTEKHIPFPGKTTCTQVAWEENLVVVCDVLILPSKCHLSYPCVSYHILSDRFWSFYPIGSVSLLCVSLKVSTMWHLLIYFIITWLTRLLDCALPVSRDWILFRAAHSFPTPSPAIASDLQWSVNIGELTNTFQLQFCFRWTEQSAIPLRLQLERTQEI